MPIFRDVEGNFYDISAEDLQNYRVEGELPEQAKLFGGLVTGSSRQRTYNYEGAATYNYEPAAAYNYEGAAAYNYEPAASECPVAGALWPTLHDPR